MNYSRYIFQKNILNIIIQIKKSGKIIYNNNLNALKFIEQKTNTKLLLESRKKQIKKLIY